MKHEIDQSLHDGLHIPFKSELSVHGTGCAGGDLHSLWNTNHSLVSFFEGKILFKHHFLWRRLMGMIVVVNH